MRPINIQLILLFLCAALTAGAHTLRVGKNGAYRTVAEAIGQAQPFDTLLLDGEVFFETNIVIDKPMTLDGQGHAVIDGEEKDEILVIDSDSVVVRGLTIQNVGHSFIKDRAGIRVRERNHILIENCILTNTFFGIYLQKSNHTIVRHNVVIGTPGRSETFTGNAIHLWYCDNIEVAYNTVKNHRDGIYFEFVNYGSIHDNYSEQNVRYGLHFMFSNHDDYFKNTFINNGSGVAVMFSKWITMKDNKFLDNWGSASFGLLLKEIYDGELSGNIFRNNTIAIHAEGANRLTIQQNVFEKNGWALKVMGSCFDNHVTGNNFRGNNFNIATNSKQSKDRYDHNYWDDYAGYDLDKDGIGDVPHRPVKLFAYIVERVPISIIMLRSLFIEMINFAEYIVPSLTPENLVDASPAMQPYNL